MREKMERERNHRLLIPAEPGRLEGLVGHTTTLFALEDIN